MECKDCGYEMLEVESAFMNEAGETEAVGYRCEICKREVDLNGEEVKNASFG